MDDLSHAQKDFLTGFYTREHLASTLLKGIIDANLHNEKFSILLIDIDNFKKINDKYGHLWGDEFLKYVSSTLRLTLQNKGFREIWMLGFDLRLESLYQEPQFVALKEQIERDIVQARSEVESFAIAGL